MKSIIIIAIVLLGCIAFNEGEFVPTKISHLK